MGPAEQEQDQHVFVVLNTRPILTATVEVVCQDCGHTFYTDPRNRSLAQAKKMQVICISCMSKRASEDEEISFGGSVRDGRLIYREGDKA